jgi:hypothetical protein
MNQRKKIVRERLLIQVRLAGVDQGHRIAEVVRLEVMLVLMRRSM